MPLRTSGSSAQEGQEFVCSCQPKSTSFPCTQCEWTAVAVHPRADARGRIDSLAARTEANFLNGCPPPQLLARGAARELRGKRATHKCRVVSSSEARATARTGSRAPGRPKTQAAACAPRPARSAIGSPSASASGRGRVGRTAPQPRAAVPRARARGRLCRRVERTPKARIHLRSRRARGCTFAGRGRAPRRRGRVRHCVWWMLSRGWRT